MDGSTLAGKLDQTDFAARMAAGAVVIDVREPDSFEKSHVPGALNICVDELGERAASELPNFNREIICYCNGGSRGPRGAEALEKLGYTNVRSLVGGLRAWTARQEG
ncbi:MAG: rhodanese-like domain-containing protein [Gammaproteobacteria bacterium PRO9]|nr:rhodanese-like domain-containing protein [Gammaproteobacteria bacterium PRO9]